MDAKHYRLKWNNFHKNLLNEFESMQTSEELADVTLTCEGINLKAHKFILSACSPYFRTVFKENPCPHPIVILKDVYYVDLIAIVNYMYHGEVLVPEDNLTTFLETAVILQVSGLANAKTTHQLKSKQRKDKKNNNEAGNSTPPKRPKVLPSEDSTETTEDKHMDEVENNKAPSETPSILESVLEQKAPTGSILERSLTGNLPDVPKNAFILKKPPEQEYELSVQCASPPPDVLHHSIKIEADDVCEMTEVGSPEDYHLQFKSIESQPHHSSQCGNCPHCGKMYSNQSALKYHVRLVHSDLTNMFCCHLCPESFDFREGYKKHMADVHLFRN